MRLQCQTQSTSCDGAQSGVGRIAAFSQRSQRFDVCLFASLSGGGATHPRSEIVPREAWTRYDERVGADQTSADTSAAHFNFHRLRCALKVKQRL